jgi:hypothetical protein
MRKTVLVSAPPAEPSQDEAGLPRTLKDSRVLGKTKSLARARSGVFSRLLWVIARSIWNDAETLSGLPPSSAVEGELTARSERFVGGQPRPTRIVFASGRDQSAVPDGKFFSSNRWERCFTGLL